MVLYEDQPENNYGPIFLRAHGESSLGQSHFGRGFEKLTILRSARILPKDSSGNYYPTLYHSVNVAVNYLYII